MIHTLLNAVTTTATSDPDASNTRDAYATFQATVIGTGAVTATVVIEGTNDNLAWITLNTITLSGTTSASDGGPLAAKWNQIRARVTAVTGTAAAVTVTMGT